MRCVRGGMGLTLVLLFVVPALAFPLKASPACLSAATVEDLVACLASRMLRRGDGYDAPGVAARGEWRLVVQSMLAGACTDAVVGPALRDAYRVLPFRDDDGSEHCVALEREGSRRGWGSLIARRDWTRDVSIQVVHPLADVGTEDQGAAVYAETGARTLLVAGAHRHATNETCPCQGAPASDAAHTDQSLIQVAVEEMDRLDNLTGGGLLAIQFHGMASSSCEGVNVYLTDGTTAKPANGSVVRALEATLEAAPTGWNVAVPGETPGCHLHGTTNVQGRILNGVPPGEVCKTPAEGASGRFVHAEQAPGFREAEAWIHAIRAVVPGDLVGGKVGES